MLHLTAIISLALGGIALAVPTDASPAKFTELSPLEARSLERRQPGGVFITTDIHWGGQTGYAKQPWDTCIRLDDPWYKSISSVGPDSGNAVVLSDDYNCGTANRATILNPGNDDLRTIGWNDRAGSFMVRQVAVVNGRECIRSVDPATFPGLDCRWCCNGCTRSGTSCCPDGQIC